MNCNCKCALLANGGGAVLNAKSLADFKQSLRGHVRRYWNGLIDDSEFTFNFFEALDRGFNRAFDIGIAQCGKKREDLNIGDLDQLQQRINEQFGFISNLVDGIVVKSDGGKLLDAFSKLSNWFSRYGEIVQLGKVVACGEELLEWVLGVAEHCESCKKLAGIVKPA